MMKIFTGEYIKALDQYTIQHDRISSVDLIARAASVFVDQFKRLYPALQHPVVVFAGPGNNGADALAIAAMLHSQGHTVESFLFGKEEKFSPECEHYRKQLERMEGVKFTAVEHQFTTPELSSRHVIIDGLFGTGLNRNLEGGFAGLVKFINQSGCHVVSIDIPSGLFPDSNLARGEQTIIQAIHTLTFEFPKLAFFFRENAPYFGQVNTLPIGLSREGMEELPAAYAQVTDLTVDGLLRRRERFSHKGDYGHALLIAGSRGMMGAAQLAARACLKAGVGKLTCQIPRAGEIIMQTAVPEALVLLDQGQDHVASLLPTYSRYQAIGIGPGLGVSNDSAKLLAEILTHAHRPLVLDADALNILAERRDLFDKLPEGSILTPHAKEMERLTGYCDNDEQRLDEALGFARRHSVYVVLKGAHSALCTPSGQVFFNATGNPGMATAGTGDVLTGVILSLLAQGYPALAACIIANYLHGLAGDFYTARYDEHSLTAGDLIRFLPEAFKQFKYSTY